MCIVITILSITYWLGPLYIYVLSSKIVYKAYSEEEDLSESTTDLCGRISSCQSRIIQHFIKKKYKVTLNHFHDNCNVVPRMTPELPPKNYLGL